MEKERIQINGVWYVKEKTVQPKEVKIDPTDFLGSAIEDDEYCFEAHVLLRDGKIWEGSFGIEYIDKRESIKDKDFWDNIQFIQGVIDRNQVQLNVLKNSMNMSKNTIENLIAFLKYLKNKEWF
ncbi:MAG: hypothetical protein RIR48_1346 [Bacteroidota bacterium]|jgi:hypothetical protein